MNLNYWSALNCPQPGRLSEEVASTLGVYRRLLRESLAVLKKEFDEQTLLYFVGEVAERHGRAVVEMWLLTVEAFGLLWESQPPEPTGTSPDGQSARNQEKDGTDNAPTTSGGASHPGTGRFVFAACGKTFPIAGFGEEGHLPGSLKGLSTIARLLRTPGVPVPWGELEPAILNDAARTSQSAWDDTGANELCREFRRLQTEVETAENDVERCGCGGWSTAGTRRPACTRCSSATTS